MKRSGAADQTVALLCLVLLACSAVVPWVLGCLLFFLPVVAILSVSLVSVPVDTVEFTSGLQNRTLAATAPRAPPCA